MNPELPSNPREELELRVTSLLLGELSGAEAASVRAAIAKDPELQKLHDDLKQTIRLVREATVSTGESVHEESTPLKLSEERRKSLLTAFVIPPLKPEHIKVKRERQWFVPVAAVAVVLAMLGVWMFIAPRREREGYVRLGLDLERASLASAEPRRVTPLSGQRPEDGRDSSDRVQVSGQVAMHTNTVAFASWMEDRQKDLAAAQNRDFYDDKHSARPSAAAATPPSSPASVTTLGVEPKLALPPTTIVLPKSGEGESTVGFAVVNGSVDETGFSGGESGGGRRGAVEVKAAFGQDSGGFQGGAAIAGDGRPDQQSLERENIQLRYASPSNIRPAIDALTENRSDVQVSGDRLSISGKPADVKAAKDLVAKLDVPSKQMLIEGRLVETTDSGVPADANGLAAGVSTPNVFYRLAPGAAGNSGGGGGGAIANNTWGSYDGAAPGQKSQIIPQPNGLLVAGDADAPRNLGEEYQRLSGGAFQNRGEVSSAESRSLGEAGSTGSTFTDRLRQPDTAALPAPSVNKSGAGALTLDGASSFTGGTVVSGGTLAVGNKADGFNLNVLKLAIEKPQDEAAWAAGQTPATDGRKAANAEQLQKALSSTTISGYVDTSVEWKEKKAAGGLASPGMESGDPASRSPVPATVPVLGDVPVLGGIFRSESDGDKDGRTGLSLNERRLDQISDVSRKLQIRKPTSKSSAQPSGDVMANSGLTWDDVGGLAAAIPTVTNSIAVGDPEWVGVLEKPAKPTDGGKQFAGRFAYEVAPTEPESLARGKRESNIVLPGTPAPVPDTAETRRNVTKEQLLAVTQAREVPALREKLPVPNEKANRQAAEQSTFSFGVSLGLKRPNEQEKQDGSATAKATLKEVDAPLPRKPATNAPVAQPEIQTSENNFSTFSLNVSDVSFKLAAASLEKGQMPDSASIRSEEFINAFDYRDPEPAVSLLGGARGGSSPIAFAWERVRYPFAHNRDLLRFSLKTAAAGRQAGRPLNVVLLLDNSGSMERADRVSIIREALRVLASQLQPQDKLSVITFARTPRLVADGVAGDKAGEVAEQVSGLTPEGGTNLEDAMNLAYQTAAKHYLASGINRVVVLTDGAANLGDVEPESLKQKVEMQRQQGIALDCFGIGWDGFNDDLLEVLSRNGDGRYGFINSPEEAATEFAGQLAGALKVAASDVKVQVEWNPKRVTSYRQIGYAKHQLKKEQFRDNTVDAAEIAAQEAGNALYTVEVNPAGEGPLATVRVRYKIPGTTDYREQAWDVPFTGGAVSLEQASPAMRLATSASAFSEWLAVNPFAGGITPDALLNNLSGVPEAFGADPRPKKLEWMIRQAKSLEGK